MHIASRRHAVAPVVIAVVAPRGTAKTSYCAPPPCTWLRLVVLPWRNIQVSRILAAQECNAKTSVAGPPPWPSVTAQPTHTSQSTCKMLPAVSQAACRMTCGGDYENAFNISNLRAVLCARARLRARHCVRALHGALPPRVLGGVVRFAAGRARAAGLCCVSCAALPLRRVRRLVGMLRMGRGAPTASARQAAAKNYHFQRRTLCQDFNA
jgi:hypothetical protein